MTATDRPLLLTRDPDLLDDLRRLSVAAGVEPEVVTTAASSRRRWSTAPMVVVGEDLADEVAAASLARRPDVVVASHAVGTELPWRAALALGAEHVVGLPDGESFLVDRLAHGGGAARTRAWVVGVVGGSGGAGASVLATALALAARRRGEVCLVDLDPGSGGLDLVLGAEDEPGVRWPELASVSGILEPEALRSALPSRHGVDVLSVDRSGADAVPLRSVPAVIDSVRAAYDVVLLDLPRCRPDVLEAVVASCGVVLLVATADVRGAASAVRHVAALRDVADVRLVVRHRQRASGELDPDELAAWLDLEVAAEIAHDPRLAAALDRGEPPGLAPRSRLARTCAELVDVLVPR
jgi:secretion/DNA translocation related CpaE-like protein